MSEEIMFEVGQVYAWGDTTPELQANRFKIINVFSDKVCTEWISGAPIVPYSTNVIEARTLVVDRFWRLVDQPTHAAVHSETTSEPKSGDTITQAEADAWTLRTIRKALPARMREWGIVPAINELVFVYNTHFRDKDSAATVHELRELVERMRLERIQSVMPKQIMSDNEWED